MCFVLTAGLLWWLAVHAELSHAAPVRSSEKPVDVSFRADVDGSTQRYMRILPPGFGPTAEHHLLIALHGHGSDRHQYVTDTRDECRAARDVAARHSMVFVSPDYRAPASWMGPKAEADLCQIVRELRRDYRIGRTILVGASMGGASALTFAALHPDLVEGVCSQNGTANHLEYRQFQDAIAASFGGTKREIPQEYKKRSAEYWPERFTMPVSITVGGRDEIVPPGSVLRLADILRQMGREVMLINREGAGHLTSYDDAVAAIEFVVKGALKLSVPAGKTR